MWALTLVTSDLVNMTHASETSQLSVIVGFKSYAICLWQKTTFRIAKSKPTDRSMENAIIFSSIAASCFHILTIQNPPVYEPFCLAAAKMSSCLFSHYECTLVTEKHLVEMEWIKVTSNVWRTMENCIFIPTDCCTEWKFFSSNVMQLSCTHLCSDDKATGNKPEKAPLKSIPISVCVCAWTCFHVCICTITVDHCI